MKGKRSSSFGAFPSGLSATSLRRLELAYLDELTEDIDLIETLSRDVAV
jgi:hypothetical protein